MSEKQTWMHNSAQWERFLQHSSPSQLETIVLCLPKDNFGKYRQACLLMALEQFEAALTLLESIKTDYAQGRKAFLRQRLGLSISPVQPSLKSCLAKEDAVYWQLAHCLYNHELSAYDLAKASLKQAKMLATELLMSKTLALIGSIEKGFHKPNAGLALLAPAQELLQDPKRFDELRQNDLNFNRLAALADKKELDIVSALRWVQYLNYQGKAQDSLTILSNIKIKTPPLLYKAVKMSTLLVLEHYEDLAKEIFDFQRGSALPLDAEATLMIYETIAAYHAIHLKKYAQSKAYLYRAEALAIEHKLSYRLAVIRMHLETVANLNDDVTVVEQVQVSKSATFQKRQVRTRFDSYLRAGQLQGIQELAEQNEVTASDVLLARASFEYQQLFEYQIARFSSQQSLQQRRRRGHVELAAKMISNALPEHPESQLYWSLLMLQIFTKLGTADGLAKPSRILTSLVKSLDYIDYKSSVIDFAATLYPLGTALAAQLDERLQVAQLKPAVLWADKARDGVRRAGKKIITVTKPIREALLLDDFFGTTEHFDAVTRHGSGHPENKRRWERSLADSGLKPYEMTTIAGIYKGTMNLGLELSDSQLCQHAQAIQQSSSFLSSVAVFNL